MNTLTFEKSKETITEKGMENLKKVGDLLNEYSEKYDKCEEELEKLDNAIDYLKSKKESLTNSLNYAGVIVKNKNGIANINGFVKEFRQLLNLRKDSKIKNWGGYVLYESRNYFNGQLDESESREVNVFNFTIDGKNYTNENTDLISLIRRYHIYSIQFEHSYTNCWGQVINTYHTYIKVNEDSESIHLTNLIGNVEDDFCPVRHGKTYEKLLNDTYYNDILKNIENEWYRYDYEEE